MPIGKINKVKVDLKSYPPYLFLAEPKFGKTGFWNDLVVKAWKNPERGLLFAFEKGYLSYDGLNVYDVDEWSEFVEGVDYIVEHPDEIDGVCFDTLDALVDCATKEVLRLHRKEVGTSCKSLLDAFKGYGRGKQRLLDICNEQINRLRSAGVAVFILAHTKKKSVKDILSGDEYEAITNNLTSDIYNNFANDAQMIMVGVKERVIQEGKLMSENRVVYLRGNSFIEAGGRFDNLPETINGDRGTFVDEFLEAFENAVKSSIKSGNTDDKTIESIRKAEKVENAKNAEIAKKKEAEFKANNIDIERNEVLKATIQKGFSTLSDDAKSEFKALMAENNVTGFKDVSTVPTATLEKLASFFE